MKKYIAVIITLILLSCTKDDNVSPEDNNEEEEVVDETTTDEISATNFIVTINENPENNQLLGTINAQSDISLNFELTTNIPNGSLSVNSTTGEIKVAEKTHFDYEVNKSVIGVVKISNATNSKNINLKVNINDIDECVESKFVFTKTTSDFAQRSNHRIIEINNKFWSYGGESFGKEIWSSSDGLIWSLQTNNPNYGNLESRIPVTFKNKVWLIGKGADNSTEVWQSTDGLNFTEVTTNYNSFNNFGWTNHQLVVFNDKLYIVGGEVHGNYFNSVIFTDDGVNWTSINSDNQFTPGRHNHKSLIFNNKLWVIGGENPINGGDINDAWSSVDGVNWIKETGENLKYSKRSGHEVVALNGNLWLWGGTQDLGSGFHSYGDLWKSCDGKYWYQVDNLVSPYDLEIPYLGSNIPSFTIGSKIYSFSRGVIWSFEEE